MVHPVILAESHRVLESAEVEMEDSTWKVTGNRAALNCRGLSASLDLGRPEYGFANLTIDNECFAGNLLGVHVDSGVPGRTVDEKRNDTPLETFVRGKQLVVTYAPTVDRPVGYQVEWEVTSRDNRLLVLEAMVSVQTPLLESYPKVLIRSSMKAKSVRYLVDQAEEMQVVPRDAIQVAGVALSEVNDALTYAEMVHPTDFLDCQIDADFQTQWRMCDHFMEKGVISQATCTRRAFILRSRALPMHWPN